MSSASEMTALKAAEIFVDVGARAHVPLKTIPGLDTVDFLTNSTMMDVAVLPEHLIIGGGRLHRARVRTNASAVRQSRHGCRN